MKADERFERMPLSFWAYVRVLTEARGAAVRGQDSIRGASHADLVDALEMLGRDSDVLGSSHRPTRLGADLVDYFQFRAEVLNVQVRTDLLRVGDAAAMFDAVVSSTHARESDPDVNRDGVLVRRNFYVPGHPRLVPVPMNKQRGSLRTPAYLTGTVNLLMAHHLGQDRFEADPSRIPVVDHEGVLFAALSRRMDGAYPSSVNPIAMWEIKEYYHTTSFGSKISDAVYISSLDGYERLELQRGTGVDVEHLVIVDAFDTWWGKGKSYLCRLIDILHMGMVTEVIFGREVLSALPRRVSSWQRHGSAEPDPQVFALSPEELQS